MLISDWSSDVCSSDLYYRPPRKDPPGTRRAWSAMSALVTNLAGAITGVHRTWVDPTTIEKAPVAYPRRAMGHLLGHGVRFGRAGAVMAAGEGIETMLSLRRIMPALPAIAGLSGAHLAALQFPPDLRRLRSAARRGGEECVSTCRSRGAPEHS